MEFCLIWNFDLEFDALGEEFGLRVTTCIFYHDLIIRAAPFVSSPYDR